MADSRDVNESRQGAATALAWLQTAAVWCFIVVLAWAPFPLGSAVSWGAGLLELLVAACWIFWLLANWGDPLCILPRHIRTAVPLLLAVAVLLWVFVQILPIAPSQWAHPIWSMTSDALGRSVPATISLNPWRTSSELLKLICAVAACWLTYSMALNSRWASVLLNAVIAIGAAYAIYGFVLLLSGMTQAQLIYSVPFPENYVSGPFMLHNSFATYAGLAALAAVAKLVNAGGEIVVAKRDARRLAATAIQFVFGHGAPVIVAALIILAAVVASASRGGFAATSCGLATMAILSFVLARKTSARFWPALGVIAATLPMFLALLASGGQLSDRFDQLISAGDADATRVALWSAARQMIADAPWRGLGLGTFHDAYPLYATQVMSLVMERAHCDYLEFAAGIGLLAAAIWWFAIGWTVYLCLRGVFTRRRNRHFAIMAIGATVLVAVHSSVDFSLQMPAVALSYATLLGIGIAQSERTKGGVRRGQGED